MSGEITGAGLGASAPVDVPADPSVTRPRAETAKPRKRRAATSAELALLRWLAMKPRPVTVGPIGNCVKRGWCTPVRAVVEDYDGRRLGFVYVVTEAGSRLLEQHLPEDGNARPSEVGPRPRKDAEAGMGAPERKDGT